MPSWPGLLVILALPLEVSIIAPLVMIFRLTKCLLAGFSRAFVISATTYFFVLGSKTFTLFAARRPSLALPPLVRLSLTFRGSIFVSMAGFPFRDVSLASVLLYLPPVAFLFERICVIAIVTLDFKALFKYCGLKICPEKALRTQAL